MDTTAHKMEQYVEHLRHLQGLIDRSYFFDTVAGMLCIALSLRCVRACIHACMRACMRACMSACVRACVRPCVRVCVQLCRNCSYAALRTCSSSVTLRTVTQTFCIRFWGKPLCTHHINTLQLLYNHSMTTLWPLYDHSMTTLWPLYDHSMTTLWPPYKHSMITLYAFYSHSLYTLRTPWDRRDRLVFAMGVHQRTGLLTATLANAWTDIMHFAILFAIIFTALAYTCLWTCLHTCIYTCLCTCLYACPYIRIYW